MKDTTIMHSIKAHQSLYSSHPHILEFCVKCIYHLEIVQVLEALCLETGEKTKTDNKILLLSLSKGYARICQRFQWIGIVISKRSDKML